MNYPWRPLTASVSLALVTGCSENVQLSLYNSTSGAISISGCGTAILVASGAFADVDPVRCKDEIEIAFTDGKSRYFLPIPAHAVEPTGEF